MKSFVGLAKSCQKNPCNKKLVKTQLARTRGERPELKETMKLGNITEKMSNKLYVTAHCIGMSLVSERKNQTELILLAFFFQLFFSFFLVL